ncbi:integrase, catalytic region, zinc finger, CCHC-type containing protein [Tanacetum coccineum]|uniref:Integrase, catalytic region, zinc finger, CCHC-type containing protein n=1 Tax=Tanacetum coccineum TaxID=301880 RepID=A0ABQ5A459_9ASTR
MAETMEEYMIKTRPDYGSGIARPRIDDKDSFELKGQFLKELVTTPSAVQIKKMRTNTLRKLLFYNGLDVQTRQIIVFDAKVAIQEMTEYSQKWHNRTSRTRSAKTSDRLVAIQAQLNNLGREIKKVNAKVYAAQVGCEQCKGPHYTKDCPLKEEGASDREISKRMLINLLVEARLMGETLMLNRSLDPLYGDYIELNDLNIPLEIRRDQVDDSMPTIEGGEVIEEFRARNDARMDLTAKKSTMLVKYRQSGNLEGLES